MFLQQSIEAPNQLSQINPNPLQSTGVAATRKRPYNGCGRKGARRNGAVLGEIVEVQGGHIIRSTGRKDRHSKVCTAKGPRDRRVRLSAHTAIQFYDIQDRLGYDRPSKAVDWLMKKAKSAIDELDELPPWKPTAISGGKSKILGGDAAAEEEAGGGVYTGNNEESSTILPPSMDSDSIVDIKSFPIAGEASSAPTAAVAAPVQFPSYPALDMQSRRASSQSEDLKLSLQSFENPIQQSHQNQEEEHQSSFPEADQIGFDSPPAVTGWDDTQPADFGRFQRLIGWNLAGGSFSNGGGSSGSGGFMLIPPPQPLPPPLLFGHGVGQATHFFTQRGPLQSNNNTTVITAASNNHHHHHQAVSCSGIGFASTGGGFSSYHIPARFQGDHEDEQDGIAPNKPPCIASGSRC